MCYKKNVNQFLVYNIYNNSSKVRKISKHIALAAFNCVSGLLHARPSLVLVCNVFLLVFFVWNLSSCSQPSLRARRTALLLAGAALLCTEAHSVELSATSIKLIARRIYHSVCARERGYNHSSKYRVRSSVSCGLSSVAWNLKWSGQNKWKKRKHIRTSIKI